MTAIPAWRSLRERYLAALALGADWLDLWRLFLEDAWFQGELQSIAEGLVRRERGAAISVDDVMQDAQLILARELQHCPDLHLDPQRSDSEFRGWLATIIRHDCQQALRHLRRPQVATSDAINDDAVPGKESNLAARIDLSLSLDRLPEPQRTIVTLHTKGWEISETAAELELSYWKVRRLLNEGLRQMAEQLQTLED
jgi:RNA polymerase sigma factor (sigma-70 family)